jgi:hypothetical protein
VETLGAQDSDRELGVSVQRTIGEFIMSFNPRSHRFDPRWLIPAAKTNEKDTSEAVTAPPFFAHDESSIVPAETDFDDALDQVASEKLCVCPVCGAIVASDGTVVSAGLPGPGDYWLW